MLSHNLPRTAEILESGRRRELHLGGQVYVSRSGEVLADGAFGEARPGEEMTPDHLTVWQSSTKPIVAVAIGRLWERGRLDPDDPVVRHIPEFATHGKEAITLRHLLTHTGGIRMLDVGWPEKGWEEILAGICAAKPEPRWVPGRRAGYHRASSWFVLGEVVSRLTGSPFAQAIREEILIPAGMTGSWIGMPPDVFRRYRARIAPLYQAAGEDAGFRRLRPAREKALTEPHPGGNGCGPIRELGLFYERLLAGGAPLVGRQTVEAMTTRHRVGLRDRTFRHVMDWGLGFIPNSAHYGVASTPYGYGPHASPRAYGHSGDRSSVAFADPEHHLVVAILLNGLPDPQAHLERIDALTAAIYEDLGLTEGSA